MSDSPQFDKLRDILLSETDLWGLSDYPATAEQLAYRQALRDLPDDPDFPTVINLPTKPTGDAP